MSSPAPHPEHFHRDVPDCPSPGGASAHARPDDPQYRAAERTLGTAGSGYVPVDAATGSAAARRWWDADADDYLAEHGELLGETEFLWCPEGYTEADLGLLGSLSGASVLEIGCGAAACSRWLATQGASVLGLDLSARMLAHAAYGNRRTSISVPLVQADATNLPVRAHSFDIACSAFGAVPFVTDSQALMSEVARVLRPGGRWVFSVTHPMRWMFPDDPGPSGLTVAHSYFDRSPYIEFDAAGAPTYVEGHRTMGDRLRELRTAGFVIEDLLEPTWPEGFQQEWGQWSPMRGELFPGTAIFCARLP